MNDIAELLPYIKLRFNIKHPSYEESYIYGYKCAVAEISEDENPFCSDSQEFNQWQEGWWAGFYGEKPLFELTEQNEPEEIKEEHLAANDQIYHFISHLVNSHMFLNILKITGAIAATAVVGYQVIELVA